PLFFTALGALSKDDAQVDKSGYYLGWESLSRGANGRVLKPKLKNLDTADAVFTGSRLCAFASFALYEGLQGRVHNVDLDVVEFLTGFYAENWQRFPNMICPENHVVFKASADGQKPWYFDPTYTQIDHRQPGTIVAITEDRLDEYYRNR